MKDHFSYGVLAFVTLLIGAGTLLRAADDTQNKSDPKKIAAVLLDKLQTADASARLQAVIDLADLGPEAAPAIPRLIEALASKDEDLRLNAAITLGKIGKGAVAPLIKALQAKDDGVRFYATWAIAWIGPDAKSAAGDLIKLLADQNPDVRRKAAYALGRINPDPSSAIAALINAFSDPNFDVQNAAADAVAQFGEPAVPALIAVLDKGPSSVRRQAGQALAAIGPGAKAAIPELTKLFLAKIGKNGTGYDGTGYGFFLAKIGKAAIPPLKQALQDERPAIRMQAVQALGQIGGDAFPILVDALGAKDVDVRRQAAQILAPLRVGDKMVVLGLAYGLKDEDEQVRLNCMRGLQILGISAKLAAPQLQRALADANDQIRQEAFYVLQAIGEDPVKGLRQALASDNQKVRINAASLMMVQGIDRPAALPVLVDGLKNEDASLRMQCAFELVVTGQKHDKLVPVLLEGLKNPNVEVRRQAVQALQGVGQAAAPAVLALVGMLREADPNLRQQAMYALHNVHGDSDIVLPALARMLRDNKDAGLRQQILNIIAQHGRQGAAAIVEALKDSDATVRQQAVYALQNVPGDLQDMKPQLEKLVKDDNSQVRMALPHVLWRMGEPAVPSLVALLKDKDENVSAGAASSLRNLGLKATKAVPALMEVAQGKSQHAGQQAIFALVNIPGGVDALIKSYPNLKSASARASVIQAVAYSKYRNQAAPLVLAGLKYPDVQVKLTSIQALPSVGAPAKEALASLAALVKDTNPQVRVSAVGALGQLGPNAWPSLVESLKNTHAADLRLTILHTMSNGAVRAPGAVAALITCLKDESPSVRGQACVLLAGAPAGAQEAIPALRGLLNDTNASVRAQAQNALSRIAATQKK